MFIKQLWQILSKNRNYQIQGKREKGKGKSDSVYPKPTGTQAQKGIEPTPYPYRQLTRVLNRALTLGRVREKTLFPLLSSLFPLPKGDKGFTLVELLVVMIIVGLLAGVSAPNLLQQIGKARETEAKNALASIIRAQQAYHFERREFAGSIPALTTITYSFSGNQQYNSNSPLGVALTTKYYSFATMNLDAPSGEDFAVVVAVANNPRNDGNRHYGGAIGYHQGQYFQVLCQSPYNSTFNPSSFSNVWNYFIAYYGGNVECRTPNQEIN